MLKYLLSICRLHVRHYLKFIGLMENIVDPENPTDQDRQFAKERIITHSAGKMLHLKALPIICSRRQFQILPLFQKLQIRLDISWQTILM